LDCLYELHSESLSDFSFFKGDSILLAEALLIGVMNSILAKADLKRVLLGFSPSSSLEGSLK
jgi:hypothetical protein